MWEYRRNYCLNVVPPHSPGVVFNTASQLTEKGAYYSSSLDYKIDLFGCLERDRVMKNKGSQVDQVSPIALVKVMPL